jgi:hypothetical protein
MGNRKLPFGYRMELGQMVLHPEESPLVRQIFENYAAGASYKELAAALAEQGVLYDAGRAWNKNMVARILEDDRYLGRRGFPALVTEELFHASAAKRTAKAVPSQPSEAQKQLRKLCGGKIGQRVEGQVLHLLNQLVNEPGLIVQPTPPPAGHSRTRAAEQALERAMAQIPVDEVQAKQLALDLAAARLEALDSLDYETERLRRIFAAAKPMETLDAELLKAAVSAAQIQGDAVSIRLKNDQIIRKKDEP